MRLRQELAPLVDMSVVIVSVSYGLLHWIAAFSIFGLPLRVLLWISGWRYAYAVLREIAQGHRELSTPDIYSLSPFGDFAVLVHFVFFPVLIGFFTAYDALPDLVRWPAAALLWAVMPASAALLAMTRNFALAMSPRHLATVIGRLGAGYWRLLGFCALVGVAVSIGRAASWPLLPDMLVANVLDIWAFLAVFALTGALIREHRTEFGIPGEIEPAEERAERERLRERQRALDAAYASLRSGLMAEGYAAIEALLETEGHNLSVHHWLFDSMRRWDSKAPALEMGKRYVERLLAAGEVHEALDVVAQCRRLSERFSIPAESARPLADYARSIGRESLAEDLEAGLTRGSGA